MSPSYAVLGHNGRLIEDPRILLRPKHLWPFLVHQVGKPAYRARPRHCSLLGQCESQGNPIRDLTLETPGATDRMPLLESTPLRNVLKLCVFRAAVTVTCEKGEQDVPKMPL